MSTSSRTHKSIVNSFFSIVSFLIIALLTFLSQRVLMLKLGYDIIGLNSIFGTIINTLSIVELGIGTAIVFSLYKPLAANDERKIAAIIRLYKKIFYILGIVIVVIGIGIIPALRPLTNNEYSLSFLLPAYFIFIFNTFFSYIFSYNHTLISADQKEYYKSILTVATKLITISVQIAVLYIFQNYFIFLAIMLITNTSGNIIFSVIIKKKYSYIVKYKDEKIDDEEKRIIKTNVISLVFHKIGNYISTGTAQIIISITINVIAVGYYTSYSTIVIAMISVVNAVFAGITAGFGNLVASSGKSHVYQVFKRVRFMYLIVSAVCVVGMFVMVNQFMAIWLNEETILPWHFLVVLCVNFFLTIYSSALGNLRASAGVFKPDSYLSIIMTVISVGISIGLVHILGITGILLGTTIYLLVKECIVLPYIASKYIYDADKKQYYFRFISDFLITAAIAAICYFINLYIRTGNGILDLILGGVMCAGVTVTIIIIIYCRTEEFKYLLQLIKSFFVKISGKQKKQ